MKYTIFIYSILLIFLDVYPAEYTVPRAAYSISSEDLDLDGDKDIIVGHNYSVLNNWSGISILLNNGSGEFMFTDSVFLFGWQPDVEVVNLNLIDFPDIVAKYENQQNENEYVVIINNFNLTDISYFTLNTYEGVGDIEVGDIENDGDIDIIISSHDGQFWGVLYNDGTGLFSEPQYHGVTGYFPTDLACGSLNEDNRDDVAICAQKTEIYFSYDTGFERLTLEENIFNLELEIADIDHDGDHDLMALDNLYLIGYTRMTIYENRGNDSLLRHDDILFQPPLSYFEISDVDRNDYPDMVCTGDSGNFSLIRSSTAVAASFSIFCASSLAFSKSIVKPVL